MGDTWVVGALTLQLAGGNDRLPTGTSLKLGLSGAANSFWNSNGVVVLGNGTSAVNQTLAGLTSDSTVVNCRVAGGNSAGLSFLTVSNTSDNLYGGSLGGAASPAHMLGLVKAGPGSLVLQGTNQCGGGYTVNAGTLEFGNGVADCPLSGPITDNSAVNINVASSLAVNTPVAGSGTLSKLGPGSLSFPAASSFAGPVQVFQGSLNCVAPSSFAQPLVVAAGAALGVKLLDSSNSVIACTASFASATVNLDFALQSLGTNAPLVVSGALTNAGTLTVNVLNLNPAGLTLGHHPLLKYGTLVDGGGSAINPLVSIPNVTAALENNPANQSMDLVVTSLPL